MKKFKVTFYTNVLAAEKGTSTQDSFSIINEMKDDVTNEEVAQDIVDTLSESVFVGNSTNTHFYRTSTITDFAIKELEETK